MKSAELDGISDYKHTHLHLFNEWNNAVSSAACNDF